MRHLARFLRISASETKFSSFNVTWFPFLTCFNICCHVTFQETLFDFEYFDTVVCSLRVVELQKADRSLESTSRFKANSEWSVATLWLLWCVYCTNWLHDAICVHLSQTVVLLVVTGGQWWSLGAGDKLCVIVVPSVPVESSGSVVELRTPDQANLGSNIVVRSSSASYFHSTLIQFTQLYEWIHGYRHWLIFVRAAFAH